MDITRDLEAESWFNLGDTRKNLQQKSAKTAYENSRKLYQAIGLDKKEIQARQPENKLSV